MILNEKIRGEKLQYEIKRAATKISTFSSGKIDKYEYLTGEQIWSTQRHRLIDEVKLSYLPLGKA